MKVYDGTDGIQENYFKVPHCWIERMVELSPSENLCYMYLLRHTWGFHEFDKWKHISLDEFMNGRRMRGGERMDSGTGLAKSSVISALKTLGQKGLVESSKEGGAGQEKKFYRLKMSSKSSPVQNSYGSGGDQYKNHTGAVQNSYGSDTRYSSSTSYLKKETNRKKSGLTSRRHCSSFSEEGSEVAAPANLPEVDLAKQLKTALQKKNKLMRRSAVSKWATEFKKFQKDTEVEWSRIQSVMSWYCDHIGQEYLPRAYSAASFCDKFNQIEDQMEGPTSKLEKEEDEFAQRVDAAEHQRFLIWEWNVRYNPSPPPPDDFDILEWMDVHERDRPWLEGWEMNWAPPEDELEELARQVAENGWTKSPDYFGM